MITAIKKQKYLSKVTRSGITYDIEAFLIIKYKINVGKSFENSEWNTIIKDNQYHYYDRIGLNKLKKLMTKHEVSLFFEKKGAPKDLSNELINKYIIYDYINDENYAKLFIDNRKTKDGPKLLLKKLTNKGIALETINSLIETINEAEILEEVIIKIIRNTKDKTKLELENKLKTSLINKGYTLNIINRVISLKIDDYIYDELDLLEKQFIKLKAKEALSINDPKTNLRILNKLLNKGFKSTDIKNIWTKYIEDWLN